MKTRTSLPAHVLIISVCLFAALIGFPSTVSHADFVYKFEIYMFFSTEMAVWMGDQIRYTVTETTTVEARLLSIRGEIILLFQLGEQQPGQYTLPWDGTKDGSPFAGMYTFELYYGDDTAAKFRFAVRPIG